MENFQYFWPYGLAAGLGFVLAWLVLAGR